MPLLHLLRQNPVIAAVKDNAREGANKFLI